MLSIFPIRLAFQMLEGNLEDEGDGYRITMIFAKPGVKRMFLTSSDVCTIIHLSF